MNGDIIENLPVDKNFLHSQQQMDIADVIFKQNESAMNAVAKEMKDGIIICILFIIFSSNQVDEFIKKTISSANGSYLVLTGIKCAGIVLLFYIIKFTTF